MDSHPLPRRPSRSGLPQGLRSISSRPGQGNIIGNPILPVIKLSGNPIACATMNEHIDLDVSKILQGDLTVDEAGWHLLKLMLATCNGRLTASEVLGHREFVITKLYRSA